MVLSILDGKVIYTRVTNYPTNYWRNIYERNKNESYSLGSLYVDSKIDNSVGNNLIALGNREFEKEKALLRSAGIDINDEMGIKEFIRHFNEVLMGKHQYEEALKRLNLALTKKHQSKENRAPTIASFFTSYLLTALTERITAFINGNRGDLLKKDFSKYEQDLSQIVDDSINAAWETMLTEVEKKDGKEIYGDSEVWKEIAIISRSFAGFKSYFRDMIRSKIDFNNLIHLFENYTIKIKNRKHNNVSTILSGEGKGGLNLKSGKKSRSIGGSVEEFIMTLANQLGEGVQKAASSGGRVISSEMALTDNVTVFSFEANINTEDAAQKIADGINQAYQDNSSLNEAYFSLKRYYDQYLSKLNDTFIIYGSTKSYSLSDSFRHFGGTKNRKLKELPALLSESGVGYSGDIERFIYKAYNTASGAIFEGERGEVEEQLKKALISSMASLLFDDWNTIGYQNDGARAIHVLQLEGIQLPLSVLLKATGEAINSVERNFENYFKTSINIVSNIAYKDPVSATSLQEVEEYWERQAEIAANQSSFTVSFLANFKTIISQWI